METLTIAHVLWGLEAGGAQRMIATIAGCGPAAVRHTVFAFHDGPGRGMLEEAGCRIRVLAKSGAVDVSVVSRLSTALAEERAAVLHAHDFTGLFWGGMAARRLGSLRVVATEHLAARKLTGLKRLLYFRELRRCAKVFVLSEAMRALFLRSGILQERLELCPIGPAKQFFEIHGPDLELRRRLGFDGGVEALVLSCSRLERHKNIALLFKAAQKLRARNRNIAFLIAGDGSERGRLEAMAKGMGVERDVRFLGFWPDVVQLLRIADIFALPSRLEELPLSVLEAMAAGVPVLAAAAGALSEFLAPEAGRLLASDDAEAWARAVLELAADAAVCRRMGEAGRRIVRERFDCEAGTRRLVRAYFELADRGGATALPQRGK